MSHTPEPWMVDDDGDQSCIETSDGYAIAECNLYWSSIDNPAEIKANARRIVACVNACAGISTDDLEDHGTGGLKHWMDDADETLKAVCVALDDVAYLGRCEHGIYALKKQRDDLDQRATEYALQCNQYAALNAELLATLVKHGKHGIHCRPEYQHSTGQIIGYKCVDIECPVATVIAKARGKSWKNFQK